MAPAMLLLALGCSQTPPGHDAPTPPSGDANAAAQAITDREWQLVAFGAANDPVGPTARGVTLRLDAATRRASGYAGCNGYGGAFTLRGDSLSFGDLAMTRMACAEGMDVERRYGELLPAVATWRVQDSALVLYGAGGRLATFRAR